jgi:hypothetical protein
VLALGLALGQWEQSARHAGVMIFAVAMACDLIAVAFAFENGLAADVLLAARGILGLPVVIM